MLRRTQEIRHALAPYPARDLTDLSHAALWFAPRGSLGRLAGVSGVHRPCRRVQQKNKGFVACAGCAIILIKATAVNGGMRL